MDMVEEGSLNDLAEHYRELGYDVVVGPRPDQVPPAFAGAEVLLVASRNGKHIVVQVAPPQPTFELPAAAPAIHIGDALGRSREYLALVGEANRVLEDVVVAIQGDGVSAEWDLSEDTHGEPTLTLRLADATGTATAVFAPDDLRVSKTLRRRLNRLWGDLLRVRTHKLLQQYTAKYGAGVG